MELGFAKDSLITLFVAIDPIGLVPIFLALTVSMTIAERNKTAREAIFIAFCILATAALGGAPLLDALGISLPAFRIAGGLMLFYIAWEMIFNLRAERKSESAESSVALDRRKSIAAFPLAMPLIAGPGSLTAVILQSSAAGAGIVHYGILLAVLVVIFAVCWLMFRLANVVDRILGFTGRVILERLLGVLLGALAVQIVGDGVKAFFGVG